MDEVTADTSKLALAEVVRNTLCKRQCVTMARTGRCSTESGDCLLRTPMSDLAQSVLTAIHESGTHRVVPVELVEEMQAAADAATGLYQDWTTPWNAMLSSSPPPV